MNNLLSRLDQRGDAQKGAPPSRSSTLSLKWLWQRVIVLVIVLALGSGALLLLDDLPWSRAALLAHAPISALPLILIGLASLGFQAIIRPGWLDFCKSLIVSAAFLLWGIDQLLAPGWLATTLGDLVIVLYVIDLSWMMLDRLKLTRG